MNGTRIRDVLHAKIAETPAQCHKNIFGSASSEPVATPLDRTDKIPGTRNMERVSAETTFFFDEHEIVRTNTEERRNPNMFRFRTQQNGSV